MPTLYPDQKASYHIKGPVLWAFALSILYWTVLLFTSAMIIRYDAQAYEILGNTIYRDGIVGFFKLKPDNVILYPLIIAGAMRLGDWIGVPYYPIQTVIQVLFLFTAQVLLFLILARLGVRRRITAIVLFYFGFSPAIVNSAFSLYCEIITYPLALGILLVTLNAWKRIERGNAFQTVGQGLCLAILFWMITLVRQVNEYVIVAYISVILLMAFRFLSKKNTRAFTNSLILIVTVFGVYHLGLAPYKAMAYKYNGYRSLTSVGSESLYANARGRTMDLSTNNILTFLARVPGDRVCISLFSFKECDFWGDWNIHSFGPNKVKELTAKGLNNDAIDQVLKEDAVKAVLSRPLQYTFLTAAEGFKMIFWESTQIGFVSYPDGLTRLFAFTPFKNGLRLVLFVVTLLSMIFGVYYIARRRRDLYGEEVLAKDISATYVFTLTIIMANIILHAPFMIATRYALPIAPYYLILFALVWEYLLRKKRPA